LWKNKRFFLIGMFSKMHEELWKYLKTMINIYCIYNHNIYFRNWRYFWRRTYNYRQTNINKYQLDEQLRWVYLDTNSYNNSGKINSPIFRANNNYRFGHGHNFYRNDDMKLQFQNSAFLSYVYIAFFFASALRIFRNVIEWHVTDSCTWRSFCIWEVTSYLEYREYLRSLGGVYRENTVKRYS